MNIYNKIFEVECSILENRENLSLYCSVIIAIVLTFSNLQCPIEWFHFQCVGLTSKPKGKWYCPKCTQERDKSKKKF